MSLKHSKGGHLQLKAAAVKDTTVVAETTVVKSEVHGRLEDSLPSGRD